MARSRVAAAIIFIGVPGFGQTPARPAPTELSRAAEEFRRLTRELGMRADSPPRARQSVAGAGRQWHGRLFENFRNDFLDAVPHEIRQRGGVKSLLRRNQFGFNLSGPVSLPRLWNGLGNTWFSLTYEGVRERISRSTLTTLATVPERTGDFSSTVDSAGNLLPIHDPQSTRPNPAYDPSLIVSLDNLQYLRDQFPGNRMPASRLDAVAMKSAAYYPAPNTDVGPFFRNNYFVVSPETNTANGMIGKVDHVFNPRHRGSLGFSFSNGFAGAPRLFSTIADPASSDRNFSTRRGSLEHTYTMSPQTLNTITFEAYSDSQRLTPSEGAGRAVDTIGLKGPVGLSFPAFRFSPYLGLGRASPVSSSARNSYAWSNGFSTTRGSHRLRFSASYARSQVNVFAPAYPAGSFRFGAGLTSLPGIVNTGHGFATFLLGLADFGETSLVLSPSYFRNSRLSAVARDHWEIRRGLTFSYGIVSETTTPRVEKYNRQTTVDLSVPNPASGRRGALVAAARNGYGRAFQPVRTRVEPSASISWNPRADSATVIRAGFGRSYQPIPIYGTQWATQGFTGSPTFISPNIQLAPAVVLSAGVPFPAYPLPDLRPDAANDTIADLVDMSDRMPVYQSFSFSIERQLPASTLVTAGYGYSGARDLLVSNRVVNLNAIHPDKLAYRDQLNDETFNRSLRPYPQFKGLDLYSNYPGGKYKRNAGYLRVEKRTTRGFSLSGYYEFSKQMDDYSGSGSQDFFNRRNEWAISSYNAPHRLSLNYVYELPLGASKPFLNFSGWRRFLVDGWSVSGTTWVSSGEPVRLFPMFNNTGGVLTSLRVNLVPGIDPHVPNPGPELWFNPDAFDQPPDFTLGDSSRTHPSLRNPGSQNHDLSLTKRFALAKDRTMEFSAVGFNFINQANWNDPDGDIGPANARNVNAGKIIGSRGGRVIQLGIRYSF